MIKRRKIDDESLKECSPMIQVFSNVNILRIIVSSGALVLEDVLVVLLTCKPLYALLKDESFAKHVCFQFFAVPKTFSADAGRSVESWSMCLLSLLNLEAHSVTRHQLQARLCPFCTSVVGPAIECHRCAASFAPLQCNSCNTRINPFFRPQRVRFTCCYERCESGGRPICEVCLEEDEWITCVRCGQHASPECSLVECSNGECTMTPACFNCVSEAKREEYHEGRGCESCGAMTCDCCPEDYNQCEACDWVGCHHCYEDGSHEDHDDHGDDSSGSDSNT